jgi:ERCC4-type nuclease
MILIDSRDGSRDLADMPCMDGHCQLTSLDFEVDGKIVPCGDAMLTGNGPGDSIISIGVEVKSLSDLLTSITTGRIGGTQMPRMIKCGVYDYYFLLYYGLHRSGPDNNLQVRNRKKQWKQFKFGRRPVPYSYLEGFLLTAQFLSPFMVKQVYDFNDAAIWLRLLDHWREKPWDKHRGLSVFAKSRELSAPPNADPVEEQMARTAASFPAIDWVKGHAAAKHFDSVEEMLAADVEDWQEVRGIGPVIAQSVVRAIRRKKG